MFLVPSGCRFRGKSSFGCSNVNVCGSKWQGKARRPFPSLVDPRNTPGSSMGSHNLALYSSSVLQVWCRYAGMQRHVSVYQSHSTRSSNICMLLISWKVVLWCGNVGESFHFQLARQGKESLSNTFRPKEHPRELNGCVHLHAVSLNQT